MHRIFPLLLLFLYAVPAQADPVGTSFPYQGRLLSDGLPYDGLAQLWFQMYDEPGTGNLMGETFVFDVPVSAGLFRVDLDFGPGAFDGTARWLDIYVQTEGDVDWTVLGPPVVIAAVPYALHALTSGDAGAGGGPWSVNGADVTYDGGGVGVLGSSSPFTGGKGIFLEGGLTTHANLFAFDYDTFTTLPLVLNLPGGNVGIGTTAPGARLQVEAGNDGSAIVANNVTPLATTIVATNASPGGAAVRGVGIDSDVVTGYASSTGSGIGGFNTTYGTAGKLGTSLEGVSGFSPTATIPAARFINGAINGIGLEVLGNARVKTLTITGGADLAERFDAAGPAEPGTVMTIDPETPGRLEVATEAYCRRVAGVVTGANSLAAGIVLGDGMESGEELPIALTGRVWVKCDASAAPIRPGDLLTTSQVRGHAMAARDPSRTPGTVLGKAMSSLDSGTGMVLVLVSLQ